MQNVLDSLIPALVADENRRFYLCRTGGGLSVLLSFFFMCVCRFIGFGVSE